MSAELRVPIGLINTSFREGMVNDLEYLVRLKFSGLPAINAKSFFKANRIKARTAQRLRKRLVSRGWCGDDGTSLFPRSWVRIGFRKKKGLYLARLGRKLKEMLFAIALKSVRRRWLRSRTSESELPQEPATAYYCQSLGISPRSYFRYARAAEKAKFLKRVSSPATKIGHCSEFEELRKHLGVPMFKLGKSVVVPQPSAIKFKI